MKNSNKVIFTLLFFLGAMEVNVSAIDWPAVVKKLGDAQLTVDQTAKDLQPPLVRQRFQQRHRLRGLFRRAAAQTHVDQGLGA